MDGPTVQALTQRLERLERENRRLKRAGALALLLAGGVFLMGQSLPASRVVEAEKLVIRDTTGKARVVLGDVATAADASAPLYGVALYDTEGTANAYLYDEGPSKGARLFLGGTQSAASFTAQSEATVALQAYKVARKDWERQLAQASADFLAGRITAEEHARLTSRGVTTLSLGVRDGEPSVVLSDDGKNPRAVLGAWKLVSGFGEPEQRSPGSLVFFGQDRKVLWKAP